MIIVGVAVVVIALGAFLAVKIYDATKPDPKPDRSAAAITLPGAFSDYSQANDAAAQELVSQVRDASVKSSKNNAFKVSVYVHPSGTRILIRAESAHDSAGVTKYLASTKPSNRVDNLLIDEQVIGSADYATKPFDGVFRCGTGVFQAGASTSVCVWSDTDTFGEVIDVSTATSHAAVTPQKLATITTQLRAVAEK